MSKTPLQVFFNGTLEMHCPGCEGVGKAEYSGVMLYYSVHRDNPNWYTLTVKERAKWERKRQVRTCLTCHGSGIIPTLEGSALLEFLRKYTNVGWRK